MLRRHPCLIGAGTTGASKNSSLNPGRRLLTKSSDYFSAVTEISRRPDRSPLEKETDGNRCRECRSPGFRVRALEQLCAHRAECSPSSMEFRRSPRREFLDVARSEAGCMRSDFRASSSGNSNPPRPTMASQRVLDACKRAKTHNKPAMINTKANFHAGSARDKIDKLHRMAFADSRHRPAH